MNTVCFSAIISLPYEKNLIIFYTDSKEAQMDNRENNDQEVLVLRFQTFIPENEFGIEEGYYIGNAIVKLLRDYRDRPEIIGFIADMLEE
jgi:hypothetical protein